MATKTFGEDGEREKGSDSDREFSRLLEKEQKRRDGEVTALELLFALSTSTTSTIH